MRNNMHNICGSLYQGKWCADGYSVFFFSKPEQKKITPQNTLIIYYFSRINNFIFFTNAGGIS